MRQNALVLALVAALHTAALFGFFYAWVCSTLWGLDQIDPRAAIEAMQGMNASVRNVVFFPVFFLTPIWALLAGIVAWRAGARLPAGAFAASAVIVFVGAVLLTANVNVPMNRALAETAIPQDVAAAQAIWQAYSQPWQFWNFIRTLFSGLALLLQFFALYQLGRRFAA